MPKITYKSDLGKIDHNIREMGPKIDRYIRAQVDYSATHGVAYMKENAPWTDRTTNARNGLHTAVASTEALHTITFSHSVPYGIWLEIANSGKYQIIMPAVRHEGRWLMTRLKGMFKKMERM